jgi:glycosyltransferase involved in cell wall biosynthesis
MAAAESVVLFLGRHTPDKGVDYLIRALPMAAAKLGRSLRLVTAGTGPDLPRLGTLAARLGVPAQFRGWVAENERIDLMREADLLAVPSVWPEPFGLVGIEAGCVGLPAVAYAVGGIPDWLIPRESGELAGGDPPTVEGLAQAMVRALSDQVRYSGLRVGAWRVARRFTMEAHLSVLEPTLQGIARAPVRA